MDIGGMTMNNVHCAAECPHNSASDVKFYMREGFGSSLWCFVCGDFKFRLVLVIVVFAVVVFDIVTSINCGVF